MARRRYSSRGKKGASSRWDLLVACVSLLGVLLGWAINHASDTVGRTTGEFSAQGEAVDVLGTLTVVNRPRTSAQYKRDAFGYRETDDDDNGCDVREDVLARDLTDVRFRRGSRCKVQSGTLNDPYTGKTIHFTRGRDTSSAVQIDHVVALNNAWRSGAYKWDRAKLYEYGNDMYNLLAVDGPANQDKEDASADFWMPSQKSYACEYVARQIGVKKKYNLSVTQSEKDAMMRTLHGCPGQKVPEK